MIKLEKTDVFGWESAVRGMRNPLNSWDKSDSGWDANEYVVGPADRKLMRNLVSAGGDHSKFMRMINVTCDITAPLYWWKEYDTYKVGTVANSCSTMHKIHARNLTRDDFSNEHLSFEGLMVLDSLISYINSARENFLLFKDKAFWWQMIQLLPTSYNQKRTVQLNYAVLQNMYRARQNHKLDEWKEFCEWVERLPYSELITSKVC